MENKNLNRKIYFVFLILILLSNIFITPVMAINEKPIINDEANLLTPEEENNLSKIMEPITEYGGVAFVSIDENLISTDNYAENIYRDYFDRNSGVVFLIDMDNRELYIFTDGAIHKTVNSARAYEITANTYRYASNGDYYACAKESFIEIEKILNHEIVFAPMRYITSILAGICFSLVFCIILVYIQRKQNNEIIDVTESKNDISLIRRDVMLNRRKTVHTSSSSGGSSGGSGGGGGSSGGGGGHSF